MQTIRNDAMTVTIDELGAQLQSITSAGGIEYLWYGDPAYWRGRSPNLFPYVGRLTNDRYTYCGQEYEMIRHGFAKRCQFIPVDARPDRVTLRITDNEETQKSYPFAFAYEVTYALSGSTLAVTYTAVNRDGKTLYFGMGGHPGFRVPLEEGKSFEDYHLTFAHPAQPWQVLMSDNYMISGHEAPYPLEDGVTIPLRHGLFDNDAIILKNFDRTVTLSAGAGSHGLTMTCPKMRYLGIWHAPKTDAPYVCLEPWLSLPSREGIVEELTQQNDLVSLEPDERYENGWAITIF